MSTYALNNDWQSSTRIRSSTVTNNLQRTTRIILLSPSCLTVLDASWNAALSVSINKLKLLQGMWMRLHIFIECTGPCGCQWYCSHGVTAMCFCMQHCTWMGCTPILCDCNVQFIQDIWIAVTQCEQFYKIAWKKESHGVNEPLNFGRKLWLTARSLHWTYNRNQSFSKTMVLQCIFWIWVLGKWFLMTFSTFKTFNIIFSITSTYR